MPPRPHHAFAALCALALATQARAQQDPGEGVFANDHLTIGVGGIYGPSYDGSDDYVASAIPVVRGRFQGVDINPRPGGIALDLIPDRNDARFGFSLGPVAALSANRNRQIKDRVVRAAGKLDTAIELGITGGISVYRLFNRYDALTLSADIRRDVNGAHKGTICTPALAYLTPLSKSALVTVSLSARHADGDYARYYYSVTPAQSAASGLPLYRAAAGWDSVSAGALLGVDLSGDLRDGGFALFAVGSWSRMLGDGRRTPYTALRGTPRQWLAGAGVAYTF